MAIAFRSVGAVAGADSGNVASIGLPAGHTTDDVLILVAVQHDNVASTVSGYTLIDSQTNGASMTVRIFAKYDGGAESAPTLTHSGGGTTHCWIAAYSGVEAGLTLGIGASSLFHDSQNTTGSGTGTLTVTAPALSGLEAGDMRLNICAHDGTDTSGAITADWTPTSGFTERADTGRIGASSANNSELSDFLSSALAGTSASGNANGAAGTRNWIGFQMALNGEVPPGPYVVETAESSTNTAGTSHTINMPAGASGNLLLIVLAKGTPAITNATINALAGWTELLDESVSCGLYVAYRVADGTEGATITLTSSQIIRTASITYEIAQHDSGTAPAIATTATGTSATPDPPPITPPSSKDYLFIAFFDCTGAAEEADDDTWVNTAPTNYTNLLQKACGIAGTNLNGMIGSAERELTTGSAEDPGTFGKDVSTGWRAQTVIVHPEATAAGASLIWQPAPPSYFSR
jgi:hypothetical protein